MLPILKYVDITATFKKDSKTDKENYRHISIFPVLSKTTVRYTEKSLTRKSLDLDVGGYVGVVQTDLSKVIMS